MPASSTRCARPGTRPMWRRKPTAPSPCWPAWPAAAAWPFCPAGYAPWTFAACAFARCVTARPCPAWTSTPSGPDAPRPRWPTCSRTWIWGKTELSLARCDHVQRGTAPPRAARRSCKKRDARPPAPHYKPLSLIHGKKRCEMQPSPQQLHGKVALITGASSGIGREAARLFARHGARLVLTARRQPELQALVAEIEQDGGQAIALAGDVRDEPLAQALVETATERFGGLDIAFNLTSAFLGAKHQIPALLARGGGSLIFPSTFVGHTAGLPGMGAYAASKAGLVGLTQVIAAEYGPRGLRANALLPGGTDTPMGRASTPTPEARAFVENLHALKRLATPAEIAAAALFLASDASSFITGTAMVVDGGVSINRI